MRTYAAFVILLALVVQWGCSRTILVPVPPRMDLKSYGTLGIIEFASNSDTAIPGTCPGSLSGNADPRIG